MSWGTAGEITVSASDPNITISLPDGVTLGDSSDTGTLSLNDGNGQTTTLTPGDSTGNLNFTLPTAYGTSGYCLKDSDGSGTLAFSDCGAGSAGVTTVGAIDTQSKSANGAVISSNNIYLQTADGTYPGLVSVSAQSFAGDKTFDDALIVTGLGMFNGGLTVETGDTFTFNGDAIQDLTGSGLILSSNALTVDNTVLDDSFFDPGRQQLRRKQQSSEPMTPTD